MPAKFEPIPNIGSQIERAVIAFLRDAYDDTAANYSFIFSNSGVTRTAPYIEVIAKRSTVETPHAGTDSYLVEIEWKYDGSPQETDNWKEINSFVGIGMAAFSQTTGNLGDVNTTSKTVCAEINRLGRLLATSDPTDNADMSAFTATYFEYKGAIRAESSGESFFITEKRMFEIHACTWNVD